MTDEEKTVVSREDMKKPYVAVWGEGYDKPGVKLVDDEFFSEDNGYDPDDIEQIKHLHVGETWESSEPALHFVVRRYYGVNRY